MRNTSFILAMALLTGAAFKQSVVRGEIYVADWTHYCVSEYTNSGVSVNPSLISGLAPWGIAVSGTNLFVANWGAGTVGEYTTSGATVNPALVSGLSYPYGIAVSGSNIFVSNGTGGTVGEYSTSGATVNPALASVLSFPVGMAVSGSDLFVADYYYPGAIGEYTLGATPGTLASSRPSLISGLGAYNPLGIAMSGADLFIVNQTAGTISEYTTSGDLISASLVSGLNSPTAIAVCGTDLFVTDQNGAEIGEYTIWGDVVNPTLVTGLGRSYGIVVTEDVPEPTSLTLLAFAAGALLMPGRTRSLLHSDQR